MAERPRKLGNFKRLMFCANDHQAYILTGSVHAARKHSATPTIKVANLRISPMSFDKLCESTINNTYPMYRHLLFRNRILFRSIWKSSAFQHHKRGQWYFLHSLTLPVWGPHTPTVSSLTLVIWLNIHLLQNCRSSILSSYCFLQFDVLYYSCVSLHIIWNFLHEIWSFESQENL